MTQRTGFVLHVRPDKIDDYVEEYLNGRNPDETPPEYPIASQIEGGLRELRVRFGRTRYRVLYQRSGNLVVLLHGFGSDGNDLIGLAPHWARVLPDTEFLSPHAPYPCEMGPFGHQWFSFGDRAPEAILAGTKAAAKSLAIEILPTRA